ncbi:MAG: hypothetical protein AAGA48_18625 [Myxococcota bacterium]
MTPKPEQLVLRNCALCWPAGVAVASFWGMSYAIAAGVGGALVIGNLWLLSRLSGKLVEGFANEDASIGLWIAVLLVKFIVFLGLFLAVGASLPLFGLALGFVPLMLGILATGIELALREPPDFDAVGGGVTGPPSTDEA